MTNEEKFKSANERRAEYIKYCDFCRKLNASGVDEFDWLALEYVGEKAQPCPFCGCSDIGVYTNPTTEMKYAQCKRCESQGAARETVDEAIKAWNRRSQ